MSTQKVGQWRLGKRLGGGGNGDVFAATNAKAEVRAVKIFKELPKDRYARFVDEVAILKKLDGMDGVMPIGDSGLPANPSQENPAWYAMPMAQPLETLLGPEPAERIQVVLRAAEILLSLHSKGIFHRDIKPDNMLALEGQLCISDFGLVDFQGKKGVTKHKERVGARWTLAPEMERDSLRADGAKADVYSLAKTLWIILTKIQTGFEGQYSAASAKIKLKSFFPELHLIHELDSLLTDATDHDPDRRPTMAQFVERLKKWLTGYKKFQEISFGGWDAVLRELFPSALPQRAFWTNPQHIMEVLTKIGEVAESNHTFFPFGGGMDLKGAFPASEPECIKLNFGTLKLVKPKRLIFESFHLFPGWSYFRLETGDIEPSGVYEELTHQFEEVLEISPGKYIKRYYWDEGYIEDSATGKRLPIPKGARVVTRVFKGDYVIFAKASWYNVIDSYDGAHNKVSTDDFRGQVEALLRKTGRNLQGRPPEDS